ncbi:MAG TPA: 50S ribosomal protein L11 methyltransferase [Chloroflexota bacterium]|nr:50S ribosomal protein L11 methyltransferase [Chloroflexota bacterium]
MSAHCGIGSVEQRAFIRQHTRLQSLPLLPELRLHLADEVMPAWRGFEAATGESEPPYWAFAWVGGQAIARYLLDHPEEVAGKRVIDLACGSGLCAIAAMRAGADSAVAADTDPFAAEAVAFNALANGVSVDVTSRDLLEDHPPPADLILAGDVCYEMPMAERVMQWLRAAHERRIRVLLGDPGREYFPQQELVQLAEYEVPATRELEDRNVKRTGVFTFPV